MSPPRPSRATMVLLVLIVAFAGAVRTVRLASAPPGLHQDEAANAWNAWCLLKTGHDQNGARWPVFYTRALGENRTTLYLYTLLPFQWLGGLGVWTSRLPSAVGGTATVLLLYWIAKRLFDRPTGLVAAALLAINPWHVQLSRFGHEAALGPLLASVALAGLIWARLPLTSGPSNPRPWRALAAGLVAGITCYGYPAVRLFVPVFLGACVLTNCRAWWQAARTRRGATALAALLMGVGATFGPLAYEHWAHPEVIAKRAERTWLWDETDSATARVSKIAQRYAAHFAPHFLFVRGDLFEVEPPGGFGAFPWYALPLLLLGLGVTVWRAGRAAPAARVALCWLVLYPAGDCLHRYLIYSASTNQVYDLVHPLRSAPGLCGLVLIAAVGAVTALRELWARLRPVAVVAIAALTLTASVSGTRFLTHFFGEYNQGPGVYRFCQVDLTDALTWIRPQAREADAIFITTQGMSMPYVVALVVLGYDPQAWFHGVRAARLRDEQGEWDYYDRVGKFQFLYDEWKTQERLGELRQNGRPDRVIFIVRPGERDLRGPIRRIDNARGETMLLIYSLTM